MRIAILMSTYNGEKYLRTQLDSILNQKGNFELSICVRDDGSSDNTQEILKDYEAKGRLIWYSGENLRSAKSFINLIRSNTGYDYYAFADQDDWWYPDKIARAITVLENKPGYNLFFSNAELVDENLNNLGRKVYKYTPKLDFETLCCAGGLLGCTMVFNNELATVIQKHTEPSKLVMHDFFLAELCLALGGNIWYADEPSLKYRQHNNNVIGVSYGLINGVKYRLNSILHKKENGIAEQADEILSIFYEVIPIEKIKWLKVISNYKKHFFNRIKLSFSLKTKYISHKSSITLRLAILFGSR